MNNEFLKAVLTTMRELDPPPIEPSEKVKDMLEAFLTKYSSYDVLSQEQMEIVILKLLDEGRLAGGEVASKVDSLKVRLEAEGEAIIFALLARMEEEKLISKESDLKPVYRIEHLGTNLLQKHEA